MSRFINPVPQFYLNDGSIASSGKLFFYENGTTTKKDTFNGPESDATRSKNTNPVVLDGEGRCPNVFGSGLYTVVFKSSDATGNVQQWSRDNVELSVELGQYADWSAIVTYRASDIVRGSDGEYYRSIENNNLGNDPTTSATKWEQLAFLTVWNTNVTYEQDDIVILDGVLYRSLTNSNLGNDPSTDAVNWATIPENYQEETVELGGDFNAGEEVTCVRQGNVVTISSFGQLLHTSGSSAFSASAVIPAAYRPNGSIGAICVYYTSGTSGTDVIAKVTIQNSGLLNTNYYALSTGADKSLGGTIDTIRISYVVPE